MALMEKDLVANVDTEWSVLLDLRMAVAVAKVTLNTLKFINLSRVLLLELTS